MMPLFSLVIPTFNPGSKLQQTLDSIVAQQFDDLEVIVCDGGSTDGTTTWLESYQPLPNLHWSSAKDDGIYDAMNQGIRASKGRFLLFLGAGDTLEPGILKQVAPHFPPEKGLALYYGNVRDAEDRLYDGLFTTSKLRTKNICHQAIFYERSLFERLGFYDLKYPLLADWEFNFRCFGDSQVQKTFLPLTIARFEGGGRSSVTDTAFLRDRMKLIRRYLGPRQWILAWVAKLVPTSLKRKLKGNSL